MTTGFTTLLLAKSKELDSVEATSDRISAVVVWTPLAMNSDGYVPTARRQLYITIFAHYVTLTAPYLALGNYIPIFNSPTVKISGTWTGPTRCSQSCCAIYKTNQLQVGIFESMQQENKSTLKLYMQLSSAVLMYQSSNALTVWMRFLRLFLCIWMGREEGKLWPLVVTFGLRSTPSMSHFLMLHHHLPLIFLLVFLRQPMPQLEIVCISTILLAFRLRVAWISWEDHSGISIWNFFGLLKFHIWYSFLFFFFSFFFYDVKF